MKTCLWNSAPPLTLSQMFRGIPKYILITPNTKNKQDRQCMHNVTMKRIREPTVAMQHNKYILQILSVCL